MGFFDGYKDIGGGGEWLTPDEKDDLIEGGVPFAITGLTYDENAGTQYGPRWVAFIEVPDYEDVNDGEFDERKVGFPVGSGAKSRDAMMSAMSEYFDENDGEKVWIKLTRRGQAIIPVPADPYEPPTKSKAKGKKK
jgi:hypothetical protein